MKQIVQVPDELLKIAVAFDAKPDESIVEELRQLTEDVSNLVNGGSSDSEVVEMSLAAGFPRPYIDFVLNTVRSHGSDIEYRSHAATSSTQPPGPNQIPPVVAPPFQISTSQAVVSPSETTASAELILNRRPRLLFDSGAVGQPIQLDPDDRARPISEQRVSALADHFPEWDLFPAGGFVKRTKR